MSFRIRLAFTSFALALLLSTSNTFGQQKGQWVPEQVGLSAGILPDPGAMSAAFGPKTDDECGVDFSTVYRQIPALPGFAERVGLNYPSSSFTVTSFISLISVITMACVPVRSNTIPVARTYLPTNGMSTCR